jgi:hypothetical protein
MSKRSNANLQNHLLLIHELAKKYPNSGSLIKALNGYFDRLSNLKETFQNINVLISILIDITYKNPRTYSISAAILSELLLFFEDDIERNSILKKIENRFDLIPNTGHLQIWLQRITLTFNREKIYSENLCKKVNDNSVEIWNSNWLSKDLRDMINDEVIVDNEIIDALTQAIDKVEVQLFGSKSDYEYQA